jgi:hypothetical protein
MSRFPSEWLALREPVDAVSRNAKVLSACANAFERHRTLSICDLGAGTGASVRAFAHLLPAQQRWTLVDHDAENLKHALDTLASWGAAPESKTNTIELERGDQIIEVEVLKRDLTPDTTPWALDTDLVTASALLDLTSSDWINRTVNALSANRTPFLATLNFDGQLEASPAHTLDNAIFNAFRKHQRTDKGFGPALGPDASDVLEDALVRAGYIVSRGDSPWHMTFNSKKLMHETLRGISTAAIEIIAMPESKALGWLNDRLSCTESLIVGHRDIFAMPKT